MATTTEDTTVTIEGNGYSTGPIPVGEMDQHGDEIARAAGLADRRSAQLTFELGVGRNHAPDFATVKIAGALTIERDLRYTEHVTVTLVDRHGEVIGEAPATIGYPAFKDHYDKQGGKTVERIHTATLD